MIELTKKNKIIGAALAAMLLIVLSVFFVIRKNNQSADKKAGVEAKIIATTTAKAISTSTAKIIEPGGLINGQNAPKGMKAPVNDNIVSEASRYVNIMADDDHDGLTNDWEIKLKTDPKKADSDGDGLSDYSEVMTYHTDPKNPDSDGDGYKDGEEVKNGHDPLKK